MVESYQAGREPRLTGGYESWTYGPGLAYAGLAIDRAAIRYIPGVARLPRTALPRDFGEPGGLAEGPRLLWSERSLAVEQRGAAPTHWPFVLDLGDPARRDAADVGSIDQILDRLSEPLRRYLGANGVQGEPSFRLNAPLPEARVDPRVRGVRARPIEAAFAAGPRDGLVVMAVIDDGIPFAHRNFLDAAGASTRIDYCWVQGAAPNGTQLYGRDLTRSEIDALRAAHGPDEDTIYARSGALDATAGLMPPRTPSVNRFGTHGSHVLDAAAGNRPGANLDRMRIVAVQLHPAMTIDTTGFGKESFVFHALDYIFACAEEIAAAYLGDRNAPLRVVVNLSYGYTGGPHDGSSLLELGMRQRIQEREDKGRPTTLVMPSGNSFGDRMHGEIPAAALNGGAAYAIPWRLQPDDRTPSYLEIWLPVSAGATPPAFSLTVRSPTGEACAPAQPLTFDLAPQPWPNLLVGADLSLQGRRIGRCAIEAYNDRWRRALIALAPTEPEDAADPAAPAGRWRIELAKTGGDALAAPVACRIHRDNDPYGYQRGGKQSWFDDPLDQRFDERGAPARFENGPAAFVRRLGTLNGVATHDKVTVVSGFYDDTRRATEYAGAGPFRPPSRPPGAGDVDLSAPSDASTALRGRLAAGTRSGSAFRLSGTSVAAPLAARTLALGLPLQPLPPGPRWIDPREEAERPTRLGGASLG